MTFTKAQLKEMAMAYLSERDANNWVKKVWDSEPGKRQFLIFNLVMNGVAL